MPKFFVFDVGLIDVEPRIWRRFMLAQKASFGDLHRSIQDSFGWRDYHAWEFRLPNGDPIAALVDDIGKGSTPDGEQLRLTRYFTGEGVCEWCEYCYDFSDEWVHEVKLVDLAVEDEVFERKLLGGSRSCPPEDCGGSTGYAQILEFLQTGRAPRGTDPAEVKRQIGKWRPDAFDAIAAARSFDRGPAEPNL